MKALFYSVFCSNLPLSRVLIFISVVGELVNTKTKIRTKNSDVEPFILKNNCYAQTDTNWKVFHKLNKLLL